MRICDCGKPIWNPDSRALICSDCLDKDRYYKSIQEDIYKTYQSKLNPLEKWLDKNVMYISKLLRRKK